MTFHVIAEMQGEPERDAPAPDRVISGAPRFETWSAYEAADQTRFAGIWRATEGKWRIAYTEWEYCEILSGVSIVAHEDGRSWRLGPGDRFVIEPGFVGSWEVVETTTKRYVIIL